MGLVDWRMNLSLPEELHQRLEGYAKWAGQTKTGVIRLALAEYLDRQGWPSEESRARDKALVRRLGVKKGDVPR